MMTYLFCYTTESHFVPSVWRHSFKLRVLPCQNEFQQLSQWHMEVSPACPVCHGTDGQGNVVQWGHLEASHDHFGIVSSGLVVQHRPYLLHAVPAPYYLSPTRLTAPCPEMQELLGRLGPEGDVSLFDQVRGIMHLVHSHVTYRPGSTSVTTAAAEVCRTPLGVCQDFAHLMIALCRLRGIHARYVNGLMEGQGETHAWVEASDGQAWRAFDPTNDVEISWGYVKIAHGRDADDCPVNRGRFFGFTQETMHIDVRLEKE